jgi:hypothetical protein
MIFIKHIKKQSYEEKEGFLRESSSLISNACNPWFPNPNNIVNSEKKNDFFYLKIFK